MVFRDRSSGYHLDCHIRVRDRISMPDTKDLGIEWEQMYKRGKTQVRYATLDSSDSRQIAFWSYFETVNIITDLMLILLPLSIVWGLQARKARKAIIFGCFAVRIL